MDKLLEALADAVRLGSAYAMPALVGHYLVRVAETLMPALAVVMVASIIGRTIRAGMTISHEKSVGVWQVRKEAWAVRGAMYTAYQDAVKKGMPEEVIE